MLLFPAAQPRGRSSSAQVRRVATACAWWPPPRRCWSPSPPQRRASGTLGSAMSAPAQSEPQGHSSSATTRSLDRGSSSFHTQCRRGSFICCSLTDVPDCFEHSSCHQWLMLLSQSSLSTLPWVANLCLVAGSGLAARAASTGSRVRHFGPERHILLRRHRALPGGQTFRVLRSLRPCLGKASLPMGHVAVRAL
eukprot:6205943-Pleurochrysis_carterae.AAC.2